MSAGGGNVMITIRIMEIKDNVMYALDKEGISKVGLVAFVEK